MRHSAFQVNLIALIPSILASKSKIESLDKCAFLLKIAIPVCWRVTGSRVSRVGGDLLSHINCSTIGADRLNFSVRNGKRWDPVAIATLNVTLPKIFLIIKAAPREAKVVRYYFISYKHATRTRNSNLSKKDDRAISTTRL